MALGHYLSGLGLKLAPWLLFSNLNKFHFKKNIYFNCKDQKIKQPKPT